jgi:ligand-binding SRPBCC domain-containing protein
VFRHEFAVDCEIEKVWNFFADLRHFENINPVDLNEKLVRASNNMLASGTEIWISTDLFFRRTWHARIVKVEEPYDMLTKCTTKF